MDERDRALRNRVYGFFVETGRAPAPEEVDADAGAYARLHDEHALVLDGRGEIMMLNPFSAVPTPYRVEAGGRSWFANCAWDALGVPAALGVDGRIASSCPDCGDELAVEVVDRRPQPDNLVAHFVVPARHWWDDIVFT
jgi:hypothetical protein